MSMLKTNMGKAGWDEDQTCDSGSRVKKLKTLNSANTNIHVHVYPECAGGAEKTHVETSDQMSPSSFLPQSQCEETPFGLPWQVKVFRPRLSWLLSFCTGRHCITNPIQGVPVGFHNQHLNHSMPSELHVLAAFFRNPSGEQTFVAVKKQLNS